jgi:CheY-like chemotaxis protein
MLTDGGHSVMCAATGKEARERIPGNVIEVVVLDLRLLDRDVDLLADIRRLGSHVVAFVMASDSDVETAARVVRLRVSDCPQKPFHNSRLLRPVEALIALRVQAAGPPGSRGSGRPASTLACERSEVSQSPQPIGPDTRGPARYPYVHWADALASVLTAEGDVRNEHDWARGHGVSVGRLRLICARADISTRSSLLLGRLVRAARLVHTHGGKAEDFLEFASPATFRHWMTEAGLQVSDFATPHDLIRRQQLVSDPRAIDELVRVLEDITRSTAP